jgi:phosphoglucomutase
MFHSTFEGVSGMEQMQKIMAELRNKPLTAINGSEVVLFGDYLNKINTPADFPVSDVVSFTLSDETRIIVRPSGTEPKLKIYYYTWLGVSGKKLTDHPFLNSIKFIYFMECYSINLTYYIEYSIIHL